MPRSRILMLSPVLPWPANTGGMVRIDALYRGLGRHFDITMIAPRYGAEAFTPDDTRVIPVPTPALGRDQLAWRFLRFPQPYHNLCYQSPAMDAAVRRHLAAAPVDLIYCNFLYALQYLPATLSAPIVLDPQNVDGQYWQTKASTAHGLRRLVSRINVRRVCRYELSQLPRLAAYVSVSESDLAATRAYAEPPVQHFICAPNGVHLAAYPTVPRTPASPPAEFTLGFLGSLDLEMNVASVEVLYREIWPRLTADLPDCRLRLLLVGRNPHVRLRRLTAGDPAVTFSGSVPDVIPWLQRMDLFVAPLVAGAGTKLKVLEAMACGLPVLGNALALQGLNGTPGVHYETADTAPDFIAAISRLVHNPEQRQRLGQAGRQLVQDRFDWTRITDRLADDLTTRFKLTRAS